MSYCSEMMTHVQVSQLLLLRDVLYSPSYYSVVIPVQVSEIQQHSDVVYRGQMS